jgi:two-component system response regulator MprA
VTEVLEEAGYLIRAVGDGSTALSLIHTYRSSLALLDVAMPVMMGDEALRRLRADGLVLPVIIMTAGTGPRRFLHVDASAVLPKPFTLEQFLAVVALAPLLSSLHVSQHLMGP